MSTLLEAREVSTRKQEAALATLRKLIADYAAGVKVLPEAMAEAIEEAGVPWHEAEKAVVTKQRRLEAGPKAKSLAALNAEQERLNAESQTLMQAVTSEKKALETRHAQTLEAHQAKVHLATLRTLEANAAAQLLDESYYRFSVAFFRPCGCQLLRSHRAKRPRTAGSTQ